MTHARRFKLRWFAIPVLVMLSVFIWASDRISLQGERTVYTVNCVNGSWESNRCTGDLAAGPRVRYRALKIRGEVLFWILGVPEPSSKLTGCEIQDGRNWRCPISPDASKSLTLGMANGDPQRNPAWPTRAFHAVPKTSWVLLDFGLKYSPSVN